MASQPGSIDAGAHMQVESVEASFAGSNIGCITGKENRAT